jgi:undecaprenyl pyrophosphate phosphatase UppP
MAASLATGLLAISVLKKLAGRRGFLPFAIWVFLVAALNAALYLIAGV